MSANTLAYPTQGFPEYAYTTPTNAGRIIVGSPVPLRKYAYEGAEQEVEWQFGTIASGQVLKAGTPLTFNATGRLIAYPGVSESAVVTFAPIASGKTVVIGGLTWTAGGSGTTAAQLATAFADIAAGTSHDDLADRTGGGSFTAGTLSGWFTQSWTSTEVTFYSTTLRTNVTNLADTGNGSGTSISITAGGDYKLVAWTVMDVDATSAEVPLFTVLTEACLDLGCNEPNFQYFFKLKGSPTDTVNGVACTYFDTGCWGQDAEAVTRRFNFISNTEFDDSKIHLANPA